MSKTSVVAATLNARAKAKDSANSFISPYEGSVTYALNTCFVTAAPSPAASTEISQPPGAVALIDWLQTGIPQFFPNHTNWQAGYDKYFDSSLVATFASPGQDTYAVQYDFAGLKTVFGVAETQIAAKLSHAYIDTVDTVAYPFPNDTTAGYVYSTGIEYGTYQDGTSTKKFRDAVFAVVKNINGVRKIVEWHESTNFSF
ncbi:hypothetical protein PRZ48_004182 [Zasmidium cellare]|uniref:Uncharacterized protein n=1 Tax=Zasmidium cellare TaxID=395010 RepID=A0ABR0EX73_ZASCE|nr:hypothetical protein PRZ48_004182 [Zasmidium cellare]